MKEFFEILFLMILNKNEFFLEQISFFVLQKIYIKLYFSSSSEGDIEPANQSRSTNLRHIATSDESDVEMQVSRQKRRANISDSDKSEHEEETGFLAKKKSDNSATSDSENSEDSDSKPQKTDYTNEASDESEMSDFIDDSETKKEQNNDGSRKVDFF